MKKTIYLFLLFSIFSCSSDEPQINTVPAPVTFQIAAVANLSTVVVDQEFTVTISSEEQMTGIFFSFDNFVTEYGSNSDYGTSKALKFNLDDIGVTTLYFKAKKSNNVTSSIIAVPITVTRGNAIKITGLQVVSFSGINTTWDPEYAVSNPNHLADVFFGFLKASLNSPFENGYNYRKWYTSSVKQNQGDLTWSFPTENLYIQPERTIRMGLVDEDNPPLGQDLMMGPPDYRDFNFNAYSATKPNTVTLSYPEINLEFIVTIEWPN
jgi:hypothetical protein